MTEMDIRRRLKAKKPQKRNIIIHSIAWLIIILFVSFFLTGNLSDPNSLKRHILIWFVHLSIFYLNYFLLIPNILIRKRRLIFIPLILIMLFSGYKINLHIKRGAPPPPRNDLPQRPSGEKRAEHRPPPPPREENKPPLNRTDHGTLYGILVFFSLSTGVWFITRWQSSEKEKMLFELAYLKQQINPHFLFNSLNSIYALANRQSPKTTELILDLADLLRYMLYDSNKDSIGINKEIEYLKNFIELEKLRITDKTEIKLNFSIDENRYMIEPMLLFPIVENALKYGANNYNESFIHISIKQQDKFLLFNCKNRIVNKNHKNREDSGIGLANVKRRLNLLYPGNYTLKVKEHDDIFNVELHLNLKK